MSKSSRVRNFVVAGCCVLGVGVMGSIPYYATRKIDPLQTREGSLSASQRQRGMYIPSGVKDAGRDPDWDLKDSRWKGWERRKKNNSNGSESTNTESEVVATDSASKDN